MRLPVRREKGKALIKDPFVRMVGKVHGIGVLVRQLPFYAVQRQRVQKLIRIFRPQVQRAEQTPDSVLIFGFRVAGRKQIKTISPLAVQDHA